MFFEFGLVSNSGFASAERGGKIYRVEKSYLARRNSTASSEHSENPPSAPEFFATFPSGR